MSDLIPQSQDNNEEIRIRLELILSELDNLDTAELADTQDWSVSSNIMLFKSIVFNMKETKFYNYAPFLVKLGHNLAIILADINQDKNQNSIYSISKSYYEISKLMRVQSISNIAHDISARLR